MQNTLKEIPALKYLLCIGVVAIHLFLNVDTDSLGPSSLPALDVWNFIRSYIMSPCLWAFFVLSGMLYFRNIHEFTPGVYRRKLRRRARSLLVPYLLWNVLGCAVFLIKVYGFGFPSCGIVEDGRLDPLMLLRGFWCVGIEYPYDTSLWFVRDLIILSMLSPLIWLMARHPLLIVGAAVAMGFAYPGYTNRYAFVYFAFGAWMALNPRIAGNARMLPAAAALWAAATVIRAARLIPCDGVLYSLEIFGTCAFSLAIITWIRRVPQHRLSILEPLYPSAFFVFALHCFYTGITKKVMIHLIGVESAWRVAAVIAASFIAIMGITTAIYFLCRRLSPRLTSLLSGGRG